MSSLGGYTFQKRKQMQKLADFLHNHGCSPRPYVNCVTSFLTTCAPFHLQRNASLFYPLRVLLAFKRRRRAPGLYTPSGKFLTWRSLVTDPNDQNDDDDSGEGSLKHV